MQETPDAWIFTGHFIDLETGFTLSRQFRQSKHGWSTENTMKRKRRI